MGVASGWMPSIKSAVHGDTVYDAPVSQITGKASPASRPAAKALGLSTTTFLKLILSTSVWNNPGFRMRVCSENRERTSSKSAVFACRCTVEIGSFVGESLGGRPLTSCCVHRSRNDKRRYNLRLLNGGLWRALRFARTMRRRSHCLGGFFSGRSATCNSCR
mgnify:CR=1 FL=1